MGENVGEEGRKGRGSGIIILVAIFKSFEKNFLNPYPI